MSKIGLLAKKLVGLPEFRGLRVGLVLVGLGSVAHAQADQAFTRLTTAICNIYNAMRGPFGLALVILMFAIGGISLMIGGRRAIPLMVGAAVGGVILAAAPAFAGIFISGTACPS